MIELTEIEELKAKHEREMNGARKMCASLQKDRDFYKGVHDDAIDDLKRTRQLLRVHAEMPVIECPNCEAVDVDHDGFGCLVCPRDPSCYCTHPAIDDGKCTICGDER